MNLIILQYILFFEMRKKILKYLAICKQEKKVKTMQKDVKTCLIINRDLFFAAK